MTSRVFDVYGDSTVVYPGHGDDTTLGRRATTPRRVERARLVTPADTTVAVVTGASRGAGLGIAHALGSHGCTVYVTGRTEQPGQSPLAGTIHETAELVTAAGGKGIAVAVDHADDEQTKALFERVEREQGRLDILVNNAAIIRDEMMGRTRFWEEPVNVIDTLDVGLRSSYVATVYAAPLMLPQRHGLVVFTSAPGAAHYVFGPSYGVHKAGMDKMAADMAVDFREFGIASRVDLDGHPADRAAQEHRRERPRRSSAGCWTSPRRRS